LTCVPATSYLQEVLRARCEVAYQEFYDLG
jgi:hypothetical protein